MGLDMYLYDALKVEGMAAEQYGEATGAVFSHFFAEEPVSLTPEASGAVKALSNAGLSFVSSKVTFSPKDRFLSFSLDEKIGVKGANVLLSELKFRDEIGGFPQLLNEAAYWRKVNSIHAWFVDNVQDGTDDCGHYFVTKDHLLKLKNSLELVLDGKLIGNAMAILPNTTGFFFGSQDYDDYYFGDLEYTLEAVNKALELDLEKRVLIYHSSW